MTDWGQFEDESRQRRTTECELCEAMCPDAVDGTLTEAERRVFERHVAGCKACAKELEEAQRGAAWLGMLKGHTPEPPAQLLAKILAETTGAEGAVDRAPVVVPDMVPVLVPVQEPAPAWALSSVLRSVVAVFRMESWQRSVHPRLAMTAAMAFFSIALTLSMMGVRLRDVRLADFTPSALQRTAANATASAQRSFQSMRVVYQVESRVSELRGEGPLAAGDATYAEPQRSTSSSQQQESEKRTDGKAQYKPL